MKELLKIFAEGEDSWVSNIPNTDGGSFNITVVLNWVYAAVGLVAVIYIIYSATAYLTSQGDPGKIKQASQSIAFAVVGLLIVILAAAITNFVFSAIGGA